MQWLRRAFVTIKGLPLSEQNDNQLLSVAAALTPAAAATGAPGPVVLLLNLIVPVGWVPLSSIEIVAKPS